MRIQDKDVYLSGPMSGLPDHGVFAFMEAHLMMKALRARRVYNPAIRYLCQGTLQDDNRTHASYMVLSIIELMNGGTLYDVVVQLPGWEDSEGARVEAIVAEACGIPCVALEDCE